MCSCIEGLLLTTFYFTYHVLSSLGILLLVLSGRLPHSCLKNIHTLCFIFTIHIYYIYICIHIYTHTHIYTHKVHVCGRLPCIKMTKHLYFWYKTTYWSALVDKLLATVYFYSDKTSTVKITTASGNNTVVPKKPPKNQTKPNTPT